MAFAVPAGACDCHTHVFGDPHQYALTASRVYTPEPASVEEMRAVHRALHMDRVVIVQPSVYGSDNACTLDGIRQLAGRARGVAVIDERTPAAALVEMNRAGIRGVRLNLATAGQTDAGIQQGSLRANTAPQAPFFRLGLVGATVPGLKIDGEIGQQLGYLAANTVGIGNFVILLIVGWLFAHPQKVAAFRDWLKARRARR